MLQETLQHVITRDITKQEPVEIASHIPLQDGGSLVGYFDPNNLFPDAPFVSVPRDQLKEIVDSVRKSIKQILPDAAEDKGGMYAFTGKGSEIFQKAGLAVARILQNREIVRIPDSKPERNALGQLLVDSLVNHQGKLIFVVPVCPDYASDRGSLGGSLSAEAKAGIAGLKAAVDSFRSAGFDPRGVLLIANTEDDMSEIISYSAKGSTRYYQDQCLSSVKEAQHYFDKEPAITVGTFTDFMGDSFRTGQYDFEKQIRKTMAQDVKFEERVRKIGNDRKDRHRGILNRSEEQYELTVRYLAQYASLGKLLREVTTPVIALNYSTPNRVYFNPHLIHESLGDKSDNVIPIFGTVRSQS